MSAIEEELSSPERDLPDELNSYNHPDFRSPSVSPPAQISIPTPITPTAPTPPTSASGRPPKPENSRPLAQQALLNRALRSRRHTLANVLR